MSVWEKTEDSVPLFVSKEGLKYDKTSLPVKVGKQMSCPVVWKLKHQGAQV